MIDHFNQTQETHTRDYTTRRECDKHDEEPQFSQAANNNKKFGTVKPKLARCNIVKYLRKDGQGT